MDIKNAIATANEKTTQDIIQSDPAWVDIQPAIECITGMKEHMLLHSGPPRDYEDMCPLQQRSMRSGARFEGWAKTDADADAMLRAGEIELESAFNVNSVGAGVGVVSPSMKLMVIEDRRSHCRAATFFPEGEFQGGLCGWGLYSEELAAFLRHLYGELLPPMRELVHRMGGLALKPIMAEGMQMGDENHTRQTAADYIFLKHTIPELVRLPLPQKQIFDTMDYMVNTPRFFHGFGQCASRSALLAAENTPYSTMVTALAGNGVEYGIKIASLGNRWFTAPAPMMEGRYTSSKFTRADQLPWMGDSCVVECVGMGGFAAATSPIVCNLRGLKLKDAISITREMEHIAITKNPNFPIPNLNFDFLPLGIDIRLVMKTGIAPVVHGGMFNHEGGLIGAGSARVPMLCFEKALKVFSSEYLK